MKGGRGKREEEEKQEMKDETSKYYIQDLVWATETKDMLKNSFKGKTKLLNYNKHVKFVTFRHLNGALNRELGLWS